MAQRWLAASGRPMSPKPIGSISKLMAMAVLLLTVHGCTQQRTRAVHDEDIQEAVLRWAFLNAETDLTPPAAYCLVYDPDAGELAGTHPRDPSPTLLERCRGDPVPVRPFSACRFTGGRHVVFDSISGGHGLLFEIGPVQHVEGRADVGVGYIQGGEWGRGWKCSVLQSPRPAVVSCERWVDI